MTDHEIYRKALASYSKLRRAKEDKEATRLKNLPVLKKNREIQKRNEKLFASLGLNDPKLKSLPKKPKNPTFEQKKLMDERRLLNREFRKRKEWRIESEFRRNPELKAFEEREKVIKANLRKRTGKEWKLLIELQTDDVEFKRVLANIIFWDFLGGKGHANYDRGLDSLTIPVNKEFPKEQVVIALVKLGYTGAQAISRMDYKPGY